MLTPMSEKDFELTVENVVGACADISKLNKRGYDYLYVASGFIAHYDIHGFKQVYSQQSLRQDILNNEINNQWYNFRPNEDGYSFYKQKGDIYREIIKRLSADGNKTHKIGVSWEMFGYVEIDAKNHKEAVEKIKNQHGIKLPENGYYIDNSWVVDEGNIF